MSILLKFKTGLGKFCYKNRFWIIGAFGLLFIAAAILQAFLLISFTEQEKNEIDHIFPRETIVIVYNNLDEASIYDLIQDIQLNHHVRNVAAFSNTVGLQRTPLEMLEELSQIPMLTPELIGGIYMMAQAETMSLLEFALFIKASEPFEQLIPLANSIIESKDDLIGATHSRIILEVGYHADTEAMNNFLDELHILLEINLDHPYYLVGSAALSHELIQTFDFENILITIVLTLALYLVLVISYRKLVLPLILIMIVQTAMWIMMSTIMLSGAPIYFLALLIVQSVIKGSALEWGVLLANSYIEARQTMGKIDALTDSINKSKRVTMTSSMIMVVVTFTLGLVMDGAVSSIMLGMGIASLSAALLTIFVLPSLLVVFDKIVVKPKKQDKSDLSEEQVPC